jgi:hypothetical protein
MTTKKALEAYFLHNRPLQSVGLEHFVDIVISLPKLKRLDLTFQDYWSHLFPASSVSTSKFPPVCTDWYARN